MIGEDSESRNAVALGFDKTPGAEGVLDSRIRGNRSGRRASVRPGARRVRRSLLRVGRGALFHSLGFLALLLAASFGGRGRRGLHPEIEPRGVFEILASASKRGSAEGNGFAVLLEGSFGETQEAGTGERTQNFFELAAGELEEIRLASRRFGNCHKVPTASPPIGRASLVPVAPTIPAEMALFLTGPNKPRPVGKSFSLFRRTCGL